MIFHSIGKYEYLMLLERQKISPGDSEIEKCDVDAWLFILVNEWFWWVCLDVGMSGEGGKIFSEEVRININLLKISRAPKIWLITPMRPK